MPELIANYNPSFFFRNGHFNTIYRSYFRKHLKPNYTRQRLTTADDDFFDVDYLRHNNKRVALLLHGLEGSSYSSYIRGIGEKLIPLGFDIAAMNQRSCSGEMNKQLKMYHSGQTHDLNQLVNELSENYEEIILVGYSLGGNQILKYLGDGIYHLSNKIKAAITVSVPTDLHSSALELNKLHNRVYVEAFLKTLRGKVHQKHAQFPSALDPLELKSVKTLFDFDEVYTSAINGFDGALDYYQKASSLQFLSEIRVPTLLLNAQDDPFLGSNCYPTELSKKSKQLYFCSPKHGGHVGFCGRKKGTYFSDDLSIDFLKQQYLKV